MRAMMCCAIAGSHHGQHYLHGQLLGYAVAEGFFATLKGELFGHEREATGAAAFALIGNYIERFCNPHGLHSHLGYVSLISFELRSHTAAIAA